MEFPQYVLKPNSARTLFPEFIRMFLLSLVFYVGLKLNFIVLGVKVPFYVDIIALVALALLSIMQVILTKINQTKLQYNFYANRIEAVGFKPKTILFADVKNILLKRSVFDNMFSTGKVVLEPDFEISNIPNANQVYAYVQKLVQNYRYSMYSQYYQQPQQQTQQQGNQGLQQ